MKDRIIKTLSVLGLALSISFAFGGAMTEQDRKNSKYLQQLIKKYSGIGHTVGNGGIDDNFSDLKEYLGVLQQGLKPNEVRGNGRQNRFIKRALKGKLDFDQIMELFYALNKAVYGQERIGDMLNPKNRELVDIALDGWKEEFSPEILKGLKGDRSVFLNAVDSLSADYVQEFLDWAEEYLNAWPDLQSVRGNWLVDGKYSLQSVIECASAAKCGLVKARIIEAQRQREMDVNDDEIEEL